MRAREIVFHPNDSMAFNKKKLAQCFDADRPYTTGELEGQARRYRKRMAHRKRKATDTRICTAQPWKGDDVT